jgi:hypothetical protein
MIKGWFYRLGHWWLDLGGKDRATIIIEIFGIVAVVAYTTVAAWQLKQMKKATRAATSAARAAVEGNRTSRENATVELRAYVSVQAEHDDALNLVTDPKTKETRVSISFFNAGQTPAHNFHADFATGGVSKSTGRFNGDHIQHYQAVGEGPFRGITAGGGGADIPAKSVHTEYLPTEQMPTEKEWNEIIGAQRHFYIYGNYQYCDEFGGYHCQMLGFEYQTSPRSGFVPSMFMDMDCFTQPVVPPNEPAPMKVLKRCPQPEEQKKAQAYADSNAGKVFPAHPEMMGKPVATPTK